MDAAIRAVDAGDYASAEPLLLQIVGLNPRDADAWHMLAVIAVRNARGADAIEPAKRALELDRRNAVYLNTLGIAFGEAQQFEEALSCFKRALKEKPDYADAHYNLGMAYRKLGKLSDAEQSYLRARRLDPAKAEVANNLAVLYSRQGRHREALALLEEAGRARPDDESVAINQAIAELAVHGAQQAIESLSAFLQQHPDAARMHIELGRRLLAQGSFEEEWREYAWRGQLLKSCLAIYSNCVSCYSPIRVSGTHLAGGGPRRLCLPTEASLGACRQRCHRRFVPVQLQQRGF